MGSRYLKPEKKSEVYYTNIVNLVERLKKVRTLNCSPSDVGMDSYTLKRLPFNKLDLLTRFF